MEKESINQMAEYNQCNHSTVEMEVAYGGPTGNFICKQCQCLISSSVKQQAKVQPGRYNGGKNTGYPLRLPAFIA